MGGFKKFNPLLFIISLLVLYTLPSNSQSIAEIENITFHREGGMMIITYDIVKAETGETFNIGVKVTSESGNKIFPYSIYGDINKDVTGGLQKTIIWDMEKDSIPLDEKISIDVYFLSKDAPLIETTPDRVVKTIEFHRDVDLGFGFGLDYGGIFGIQIEYIPISHLGIFVTAGVQPSGFGWQVGATGYFIRKTNKKAFRPYAKFMYGTNASIYVKDFEELNKIYLGPSLGFGMEFRFGKHKSNGINGDLNFPFRSQEYKDDVEALKNNPAIEILSEPMPFTISVGYHFEF